MTSGALTILIIIGALVAFGGFIYLFVEAKRTNQSGAEIRWKELVVKGPVGLLVIAIGATLIIFTLTKLTDSLPVASSTDPGKTPTAPTSPPSPPAARVEFSQPSVGATMRASQDVSVAGSVTGLAGDALWIVSKAEIGDGQYYLTQIGPVADHDGQWSVVDEHVGDDSDKGHKITYFALQANRSCSERLTTIPQNQNGSRAFILIPNGCAVRAQRAIAVDR